MKARSSAARSRPAWMGVAGRTEAVDAPPGRCFGRSARDWQPSIAVVIPCYNEAANLGRLLPRLQRVLESLTEDWEVILVDDGSRDETAAVLEFWSGVPGFQAVQLSRNFGKEVALTAGLDAVRAEIAVLMDADLQHPPELIVDMLARWREGYDVVYAVREHRHDEGLLKRKGARWFYRLLNLGGRFTIPPDAGDFRLLDQAAIDALRALPERNRFMKGLYAWVGFDSVALTYQPDARAEGRSRFGLLRLFGLSVEGLTAFTTWPLRLVSVVGLALAMVALGYGAYLIEEYLRHGHPIPGWTTIVAGLALFSGIQMIALGVLGEYVSRIFEEVKRRPLYVVRHRAGRPLRVPPP